MLKKKGVIVLLFFVLILVLGASGCQTKKKDAVDSDKIFIGGSGGLEFGFVESEPPNEIYDQDQDPFFVSILFTNNGEFSVPTGGVIASLAGLSQDAFGLKEPNVKSISPIEAKSKIGSDILQGDNEVLQFKQLVYKPDLLTDFSTDLKVDVCYLYQTTALANICLKKNSVRRDESDLCVINNEKVVSESSAAPVQISDVKQRNSGANQIAISFKISNQGAGSIYPSVAFVDKCYENREQKDFVDVKVKSGSRNLKIKCSQLGDNSAGSVRIVGGERVILCDVDTSALQESAFEEPFEITATYFYRDILKKKLTVKAE